MPDMEIFVGAPLETITAVTTQERGLLSYESRFCPDGQDPYTMVQWKTVDVSLKDQDTGAVIFEQFGVEVPITWSERAALIVAQKYFYGKEGTPERETSVRQVVARVVNRIRLWGLEQNYFVCAEDAEAFAADLAYLLLTQRGAFNSPVWFNLGIDARQQQVSACFINSVDDCMSSIAALQETETIIFKQGSGSGVNLSALRSSKERLSGGGIASGPVSFMRGFDAWAGIVKSGGGTRRAAAMRVLNADHPDIVEFVTCKAEQEHVAQLLVKAGLSAHFDDPKGAYALIRFQNANHSIRVTDEFMTKVLYAIEHPDEEVLWDLHAVVTEEVTERIPILALWEKICQAAWSCGDPGIQFDSTFNAWHTCPSDGRINSTNPCGEFAFLDNSACNLASLNLMRFRKIDGTLDIEALKQAVDVFVLAQDILIDKADYPTAAIKSNSMKYRPLGLGYANLGAYLMSIGVPYDSDAGRQIASDVTSVITSQAYLASVNLALVRGPFEAYDRNRAAMLEVMRKHMTSAQERDLGSVSIWDEVIEQGALHGFRNSQVTLCAPTGTISFMMDCDTTGIEPEASLYKMKSLVGGGTVVMENRIVEMALDKLTYQPPARREIMRYLARHKHLDGCSQLLKEHLAVFDCAIPSAGKRVLSPMAHVKMLAAIQPFISGSISKTVNLPNESTPEQIGEIYIKAWQRGIKNIAVYRDNCKKSQPLITAVAAPAVEEATPRIVRRKLANHQTNMHRIRFAFQNIKGYILATPYEDTGMPGEIFVRLSKEGSTMQGLVDGWAQSISYCLQYGVPLEVLVQKFSHTKFEPMGYSTDPDIRFAHSIYDAIVRKLGAVFLHTQMSNGHTDSEVPAEEGFIVENDTDPELEVHTIAPVGSYMDAPPCTECGAIMVRNGSCYSCSTCGATSGCS